MTNEMAKREETIAELVAIAKDDHLLWQQLKEREIEFEQRYAAARAQGKWLDSPDLDLPPLIRPVFLELVAEFMRSKPEKYKNVIQPSLGLAMRREIRIELGLPL